MEAQQLKAAQASEINARLPNTSILLYGEEGNLVERGELMVLISKRCLIKTDGENVND